jgi:hypothetical protein
MAGGTSRWIANYIGRRSTAPGAPRYLDVTHDNFNGETKMNAKLAAALFALVALPVAAQTATPRVDQRQANQEARIQQGVASGQLTNKEAAKLEAGQAKVQAKEDKAKSDGVVTAKERAKLAKAQDKQSRKIAKQKHDKQKKAPAAG